MTINDIDNKNINYNDKIIENINKNTILIDNNKLNIDTNYVNENKNEINNNYNETTTIYYHLADETDDSSNESSSLFSSDSDSDSTTQSYSNSTDDALTDDSYSFDESSCSSDNENDLNILEIIKQALNKLKIKTMESKRNDGENIDNYNNTEYIENSIKKLFELDYQLKELSCDIKELIVLFNKYRSKNKIINNNI